MRAYENIKFVKYPDVADIQSHGRKSSSGRLPGPAGEYIAFMKSRNIKARIRRTMKRRDKVASLRWELNQ